MGADQINTEAFNNDLRDVMVSNLRLLNDDTMSSSTLPASSAYMYHHHHHHHIDHHHHQQQQHTYHHHHHHRYHHLSVELVSFIRRNSTSAMTRCIRPREASDLHPDLPHSLTSRLAQVPSTWAA
eukprot:761413-Hanusia_phi.AAC.4